MQSVLRMIDPNKIKLKDSLITYVSTVARDTGSAPAMSVFGRDAAKSARKIRLSSTINQGSLGNFEKSGFLFSLKAVFPSFASSDM